MERLEREGAAFFTTLFTKETRDNFDVCLSVKKIYSAEVGGAEGNRTTDRDI